MWPVRCTRFFFVFISIILLDTQRVCSAITNTNFNEHIRKYSVKEDNASSTNVTTLMKQGKEQYSHFIPIPNPATFKAIADNELSSSSHSRGLLHNADYGLHDYEEGPHQVYEYHIQNTAGHGHVGFDHHPGPIHHSHGDHGNYHGGYYDPHSHDHHHIGHHYKHHDHALAAKTLLWPIAGIALLGAAAALVTNPVLLQLGVVSGRRKRRDTEQITGPDVDFNIWSTKPETTKTSEDQKKHNKRLPLNKLPIFSRLHKQISKERFENGSFTKMTSTNEVKIGLRRKSKETKYIPILLKKPKT